MYFTKPIKIFTENCMLKIYTDGACVGNGQEKNQGGVGVVFVKDDKVVHTISKKIDNTTNNRTELLAIIEGLILAIRCGYREVQVYSDSDYCVKGASTWKEGWERKNWRDIKNPELWFTLSTLVAQFDNFNIEWVRGHAGNKYNEIADELANPLPSELLIF